MPGLEVLVDGLLGVAIVTLIVGRRRSIRTTGEVTTIQAIATGVVLGLVVAGFGAWVLSAILGSALAVSIL